MVTDKTSISPAPPLRPPLLRRASLFGQSSRLKTAEAQHLISFFCVAVTVAIDFMGLTIQSPLLPFYVKEFDDARDIGVGAATAMLVFAYALSQMIATPVFGFGSDRFGRRPALLLSLAGSCLGFLGQAFANSLVMLCILRFITGLFGGSRPVALAYIADTVPPEQQPKYISGVSLLVSAAMFLAPVLGGSMGLVDLALPCYFQSGSAAIVFLMSLKYLVEPQRVRSKASGGSESTSSSAPPPRPYKCWLVANAMVGGCIMYAMTSWQTILPVHAAAVLGLDANKIGLMMGTTGLTIAVAQIGVFVPLSRRISLKAIGCGGIVLAGITASAPLMEDKAWYFFLMCLVQGFGIALVMPGVSMTVNLIAPAEKRGGLVALTIMFQAFTRVVAPLVSGPLYDSESYYPFVVILACMTTALLFEAVLIIRVPKLKSEAAKAKKADDPDTKEAMGEETERQTILENLYKVHEELTEQLNSWREKKEGFQAGKSRKELGLPPEDEQPPKATDKQKQELGLWLADMLVDHNYKRWTEHLDILKCMCKNAFPKIRDVDFLRRHEDIEYILQSHLMLEQRWERFVLDRSFVPLAANEFDIAGLQDVVARSRTNSEADKSVGFAEVCEERV